MKILFCGDIVGKSGRRAIQENVGYLREELKLDLVIASADNASGGFGINKNTYEELLSYGVDILTGGDHIWDQKETISFINNSKSLLRPLNFPKSTPGAGAAIFTSKNQQKILVIHALGQVFIKYALDCPFAAIAEILKRYKLKEDVAAIIVDFHAEASSEKMAMGKYLDGKVSLVVGSHTHIPTNDFHIMAGGTAYHTDSGMCGDYNSIIGMTSDVPLRGFLSKRKTERMSPAQGEATFCATLVEIDDKTGLAKNIQAIKKGGTLEVTSVS